MSAPLAEANAAFKTLGWIMPLVGICEIVGGLLLIFKKTRALGAIMLFPILIGIVLANISTAPSALPIAAIMFAVVTWVLADNWNKYTPTVSE